MKTKKNSVPFIIAISTIYIATVLVYAFSIFTEYQNGQDKSRNRFNSITKDISRISKTHQPKTKEFYDEVLNCLGNVSDIAGIQLSYGNELIFSYPKDLRELNSIKSYLVNPLTTTVFANHGIPINITASIYVLKPSSIFYKGRIAFGIILGATIITAIYLILFIRNGTFPTEAENDDLDEDEIEYPDVSTYDITPEEDEATENSENSKNDDSDTELAPELSESQLAESISDNSDNSDISDNGENSKVSETASESEIETSDNSVEAETKKEDDVLAFLNKKKDPATEAETENKSEETEDETTAADNQPKGLFCPDTGFGWEEYMLKRLDNELLRSASSDQDISLFTIKIKGIDWNSECGKKVSKIIIEIVKFNDLVFNYENDGASAIIQNQNTDQALVTAENLYNELTKVLKENDAQLHAAIGISTRSLRLISASRLANESKEALNRASADPDSPIIAYRVNPERYKDYLASESFQEKDRPVEKTEDEKLLESLPEPPEEDLSESEPSSPEPDLSETEIDPGDFEIDEELKIDL